MLLHVIIFTKLDQIKVIVLYFPPPPKGPLTLLKSHPLQPHPVEIEKNNMLKSHKTAYFHTHS